MPYRKIVFAIDEFYHTVTRGVAKEPIFINKRDYTRALNTIDFYRYQNPPVKYSRYNSLSQKERENFIKNLKKNNEPLVEIVAYCLMPNHIHFLLKQLQDRGVPIFMRNFENSYAKYFNTKYKRNGALFQAMFKAVRIETNEQLLHVSRYIHLNPVTSYLIEADELANYPWSSLPECLNKKPLEITRPDIVLDQFKSKKDYLKFVLNQADYQRELQKIKQLVLEK